MFHRVLLPASLWLAFFFPVLAADSARPLRALLITGGCCHNYPLQTESLTNAVGKLATAEWTVVDEGGQGTRAEIPLYSNPDWAKSYDVVVHNECFADTTNHTYWKTPMDELYVIDKLWPNTRALATSVSERDGKTYPVIWTSQYGNARVFGTTYGHSEATFRDPVFLGCVARGVLWAAGRLK